MSGSRVSCFFEHEGRHLYGRLYLPPASRPGSVGLVLCPPFADEAIHAHRVLVEFAERLADQGIPALLFDYAGTGDSEGQFEDASLDSYFRDIGGAVEYLRRRAAIPRCGLLGLRLGATLAARVGRSDPTLAALVLWAPIPRCREYFRSFLRSRLLTEVTTLGRRTETVRSLEERLMAGEVVDVRGYGISETMARGFLDHGPDMPDIECAAPTLRVDVRAETLASPPPGGDGPPRAGSEPRQMTARWVTDEPFWDRARVGNHDALFSTTVEWLTRTVAG